MIQCGLLGVRVRKVLRGAPLPCPTFKVNPPNPVHIGCLDHGLSLPIRQWSDRRAAGVGGRGGTWGQGWAWVRAEEASGWCPMAHKVLTAHFAGGETGPAEEGAQGLGPMLWTGTLSLASWWSDVGCEV